MSTALPRRIGAGASEGSVDLSKPGRKTSITWSITDGAPFGGFGGSGSLPAAEG